MFSITFQPKLFFRGRKTNRKLENRTENKKKIISRVDECALYCKRSSISKQFYFDTVLFRHSSISKQFYFETVLFRGVLFRHSFISKQFYFDTVLFRNSSISRSYISKRVLFRRSSILSQFYFEEFYFERAPSLTV